MTTQGRTFAYCRVSTVEQTTENQILAIRAAGWDVPNSRVIEEKVSGSHRAMERAGFVNLIENKMEAGDRLVVLKLDRLGRDNIDVQQTVALLLDKGIKLTCLDLPFPDLSSNEGKLILQLMAAFSEFERGRIRERTQEGLVRAKAEGKKLGRPVATQTRQAVQGAKARGLSQSKVCAELDLSIATVKRHWKED
ncbi:recombinase family protein [Aeromonas sp. MR16]|uniref:recombinase family protein n=1 Tax=Aeromonas sp. MR16 TaxID=2923420 RepID=UPI001F4A1174|nr:recombinase family protein [Aeromonas sp. MR16]MCH7370069.1 recombinase family protein [Aeromonas sp. MR16]